MESNIMRRAVIQFSLLGGFVGLIFLGSAGGGGRKSRNCRVDCCIEVAPTDSYWACPDMLLPSSAGNYNYQGHRCDNNQPKILNYGSMQTVPVKCVDTSVCQS